MSNSVLDITRRLCYWVHLGDGCDCSRADIAFEFDCSGTPVLRMSWRSGVDGYYSHWDVELRPGSLLGVCVDRDDGTMEGGPATMSPHSFTSLEEMLKLPAVGGDDEFNELTPEEVLKTFYSIEIQMESPDGDFLLGKGPGEHGSVPVSGDWEVVLPQLLALDSFWTATV